MDAAFLRLLIDADGERGRGSRHIGSVCACGKVCENAVRAKIDLLHILWIADDGDDGILPRRALARTFAVTCAARKKRCRLAFRAVVDAELIACIDEMSCHRCAHDAEADESNFFHIISSILLHIPSV